MKHHTKEKGDIGLGFVIAHLLSHGISVCLPLSEHLPFDLIACYPDNTLKKVSVKYRAANKNVMQIDFRSVYSNSKGSYAKKLDKKTVDMFAVYCPDTKQVYYFDHNKFNNSVSLRIALPRNKMGKYNMASDYISPFLK